MTPALVLAGILAFLCLPFLGKWVCHLLLHLLMHAAEHSERVLVAFDVILWGILVAMPVCALLGYWWGMLDAGLLLLIAARVFTAH